VHMGVVTSNPFADSAKASSATRPASLWAGRSRPVQHRRCVQSG
jgi:hypothetical protein